MPRKADDPNFKGFRQPKANYSKLPHQFVEMLPQFKSLAELKVIIYLLRHTWGFREYGKAKLISIDEFVKGRKRRDGSRFDAGTGLSEQGVRDGLETAIGNGYILCEVDDRDKGRVKKFYKLNMSKPKSVGSGVQSLDPQTLEGQVKTFDPIPTNSVPRTEKETKERNSKKDNKPSGENPPTNFVLMKNAIAVAFGYDTTTMTTSAWNLIGKAASELLAVGATPADMLALHKFCASKFKDFGAMALSNNWSIYCASKSTNGNGYHNGKKFTVQQQILIAEQAANHNMSVEDYLVHVEAMQK